MATAFFSKKMQLAYLLYELQLGLQTTQSLKYSRLFFGTSIGGNAFYSKLLNGSKLNFDSSVSRLNYQLCTDSHSPVIVNLM